MVKRPHTSTQRIPWIITIAALVVLAEAYYVSVGMCGRTDWHAPSEFAPESASAAVRATHMRLENRLVHGRPVSPEAALGTLNRVRDVQTFVKRLERVWKQRNWRILASAMANSVVYANSDEGNDWFKFRGSGRRRFLRRFLSGGYVAGKNERQFWSRTFREPWRPVLLKSYPSHVLGVGLSAVVLQHSATGRNGIGGVDDYDAYILFWKGNQLSIFLKREGCYWRVRGFYRNSA